MLLLIFVLVPVSEANKKSNARHAGGPASSVVSGDINGNPDKPIENVILKNIDIKNAKTPYKIKSVNGLIAENVKINGKDFEYNK